LKKICWISLYPDNPSPMASISHMLITDILKNNKKEFEISLITYKEKLLPKDLPIKIYPFLKKESIKSIVKTLQVIKKENFDIIHILSTKFMHGRLYLFLPFFIKKVLRMKAKIIISAHEFYSFSNLRQFIVGGLYHLFLLRYSDLLLVFNKEYLRMITSKRIYKKNRDNVIFISKNVQSMRYEEIKPSDIWEKKKITPFILFFGFLRFAKGVPYLIIAFKKILKEFPNMNLVIAGGIGVGPSTKDYYKKKKKVVNKLCLEEKIIFTDFISKEEVIELFKLAEVSVYPYLSIENSGALFVALYTKKAIITSDISGFRNILTHKKDSLLFKPKNSQEIANALIRVLKDKELKKKIENGAGQTYENNSFEKLVNKYITIFSKDYLKDRFKKLNKILKERENSEILVSIIIPAYNEENQIINLLNSLLNQKFLKKFEIIFIDNDSTDNTVNKVKEFKKLNKIENLKLFSCSGKLGKVRNLGVFNSSGKWIAFIDADEVADPYWLIELMKMAKNYEIVMGSINTLNPNITFITKFFELLHFARLEFLKKYTVLKSIGTGNLLVNREIFKKGFIFDNNFPTNEDGDFSYRLYKKGYKFGYNYKAKIYHKNPETLKQLYFFQKKMILGKILIFLKLQDFYTFSRIFFNIFYFLHPNFFRIYKKSKYLSKTQFIFLGLSLFIFSLYSCLNFSILLKIKSKIARPK